MAQIHFPLTTWLVQLWKVFPFNFQVDLQLPDLFQVPCPLSSLWGLLAKPTLIRSTFVELLCGGSLLIECLSLVWNVEDLVTERRKNVHWYLEVIFFLSLSMWHTHTLFPDIFAYTIIILARQKCIHACFWRWFFNSYLSFFHHKFFNFINCSKFFAIRSKPCRIFQAKSDEKVNDSRGPIEKAKARVFLSLLQISTIVAAFFLCCLTVWTGPWTWK